jgi:hypothetical protein
MLSKRRISLALAATAALSIAAPAQAAIVITGYSVAGVPGSGTFSLSFDTVANSYSLLALDFALAGPFGPTTYNTGNAGLVSPVPAPAPNLVIGADLNGRNVITDTPTLDADFLLFFDPTLPSQSGPIYYLAGLTIGERINAGVVTVTQVPPSGVPEPSTWAMMLLGFGAIGLAMRRRKVPALARKTRDA